MTWYTVLADYLRSRPKRHRMIWRPLLNEPALKNENVRFNQIWEERYLERFYLISTKWLGIYLHRFWSSDEDGLHSHPWNFISILLSGSYLEEEPENLNDPFGATRISLRAPFKPLLRFRSKKSIHRITLPNNKGECWSLFIRFGLKRQIWGFFRNGKFEPADVQSRADWQPQRTI